MKLVFYILFHFFFSIEYTSCVKENIVLFITDDQDIEMNGMDPMIKTKKLLKEFGTTFTNAFATSPLCCPSRASILTGLYQHNHQVLNNSLTGGCSNSIWQSTHETHTFAVELQKLGYSTFYAGKYLNQYGLRDAGGASHIPPGWQEWIGLIGNSKYYNYTLSINGKKKYYSNNYLTKVLGHYSLSFIEKQKDNKPFLMVIAPPAPHEPFTPEPKYKGYFNGIKVPRTIQFNYSNNTRKHWLTHLKPLPLPGKLVNSLDEIYARRWETLLSVDDLIESVIRHLEALNFLDNTYIIFTSDNGFHLGQFSFAWDKRQMYEFDIKVPFLVRGPNIPSNYSAPHPVILPDIAPTLLYIGGLENTSIDGKSFLPIQKSSRETFVIEYHGEGSAEGSDPFCQSTEKDTSHCSWKALCKCQDARNNTYVCVRKISLVDNFIYCKFYDEGIEEAYDLKRDPFQLYNIAYDLKPKCKFRLLYQLNQLKFCKGTNCTNNETLTNPLKLDKCFLKKQM